MPNRAGITMMQKIVAGDMPPDPTDTHTNTHTHTHTNNSESV